MFPDNFRSGYLAQGTALGRATLDVTLTADDAVIDTQLYGMLRITSDNTTATNRTFTITDGAVLGQDLVLILVSGSSTSCDLQDTGNVALSAAWQPLQYDSLYLVWQGTKWVEVGRADN